MGYAYSYHTKDRKAATECPECGQDWTKQGGIALVVCVGGRVQQFPTNLYVDGNLEDIDRLVENGYHSGTLCGGCGEQLQDIDGIVEEVDTSDSEAV